MIAVVTALTVTLAGCSPSGRAQRKAEKRARDDAIAAVIQKQVAATPGVVRAEVTYCDGQVNCSGEALVTVTVEPGTDLDRIADLAVGAIWRSRLDPVKGITVGVGDGQGGSPGIERDYTIFEHKAELEAKYGPRPVGSN